MTAAPRSEEVVSCKKGHRYGPATPTYREWANVGPIPCPECFKEFLQRAGVPFVDKDWPRW